jgi:hypothetical protein
MEKTAALNQLIKQLSDEGFTGTLTLNFFRGGIGNVNKSETFRLEEVAA